ncbi:hypothetical protein ACSA002_2380 [Salmonella phage vB_SalM_SA002]|nr:hypothetical protein ACSA002_2380 [Salmonella phage vB_SalM_SA002]
MFPGFEQFDQIFSDKQKQAEPKTPQYSPENPLYTYGSGTTVVNGQQLYTVGTASNQKQHNLYSY